MAAPLAGTGTLVQASGLNANQDVPELVCRISFQGSNQPDPLTWQDMSTRVRSFTVEQGAENEQGGIDTGRAVVVFDNRDRELDAFNTSSTLYPNVKPRRRLWLQSLWAGAAVDQFYGWTGSFVPSWVGNFDAVVTVEAQDAFSIMAEANLPVSDPPRDTYSDVVAYDQPYLHLPCDDQVGSRTLGALIGQGSDSIFSGSAGDPVFGNASIVVGDQRTSVSAAANGEFRWADTGGTLDLEGADRLSVDMWVKAGTGGTIADIIGITCNSGPTRFQFRLGPDGSGHARAMVTTTVNEYTATGTTVLAAGSIYHIALLWVSGALQIFVNGTGEAATGTSGTIKARIASNGLRVALPPDANARLQHVAVYPHLPQFRITAHYQAGTQKGRVQEAASTRIDELLQATPSVRFVPRRIRSDSRPVQATYYHGQEPRGEIDEAVKVAGDPSMFFFGKDGAAVFLDHAHRSSSPWNTVQATFDDDGTDLQYLDLEVDDGSSFISNDVRGHVRPTGAQGTLQQTTDTTSIAAYGSKVLDLGETFHDTDANLGTELAALLAKYKDPIPRVTAILLEGSHNSGQVMTQILGRELGDKIEVFRRPIGGGSAIDQVSWIRKRVLSGDTSSPWWRGRWALSSLGGS